MIQATIIEQGGQSFANCLSNLPVKRLPYGADLKIVKEVYGTPVADNGVFRGYKYTTVTTGSSLPTIDSFKGTQVVDVRTGISYTVVADAATILATADNGTVTPGTVPTPIPAYAPCVDTAGNYTYIWEAPYKAGSDEYKALVTVDGAQAVAPLSTGHATIAAMITWLNTNYAAAGTWSNPANNVIQLVNTTGKVVGLAITVGNYA